MGKVGKSRGAALAPCHVPSQPQPPRPPRRPQGPAPTIFEGQELKDTVDNGHNDGECQQVGVGFQKGNLGVQTKGEVCEHC